MAKVFYEKEVNGTTMLFNVTTPAGDQGSYVRTLCNGLPFWWFATIPTGHVVACDFTGAPVATSDIATNDALIAAITVQPADVLTYES